MRLNDGRNEQYIRQKQLKVIFNSENSHGLCMVTIFWSLNFERRSFLTQAA